MTEKKRRKKKTVRANEGTSLKYKVRNYQVNAIALDFKQLDVKSAFINNISIEITVMSFNVRIKKKAKETVKEREREIKYALAHVN